MKQASIGPGPAVGILCIGLLLTCIPTTSVRAEEEGTDYGYWCTKCGVQHAPGEICPQESTSPAYQTDRPDGLQDPSSTPRSSDPAAVPTKTLEQKAADLNEEGEALYRAGKYGDAEMKFWLAGWNDSNRQLYKDNLNKAKYAREEQEEKEKQLAEEKKRAELNRKLKLANEKLKNAQPLGVSGVEARDPKGIPAANAQAAKGLPSGSRTAFQEMPKTFSPQSDEDIIALLFLFQEKPKQDLPDREMLEILMGAGPAADQKAALPRIFQENPELPLLNPLRQPKEYRAWEEAANQRMKAELDQRRTGTVIKAMEADVPLVNARERIAREEAVVVGKAQVRQFNEVASGLEALWRKHGLKRVADVKRKNEADPEFRKRSQAIVLNGRKRVEDLKAAAIERSRSRMNAEAERFSRRHP